MARDLRALPKAHLHLHLEGGMRPATLIELAARYGIAVPAIGSYTTFTEFAALYAAACAVMQTEDDLRRLVRETVEDAAASGAVWLEMGSRPSLHVERLGSEEKILEILLDEARISGERLGVGVGALVTIDRTLSDEQAVREAQIGAAYAGQGVVSIGLANDEVGHPPEDFTKAFAIGRDAGLLSCPHAGELEGAASVRGALDALGADRIQHGIRALEEPALVERLAAEGVCLDVCPTSNACLNVVPSIEAHPLPVLLDAGVRCSINGDDPLFFEASLAEEYELCRTTFKLSDPQLAAIARSSIVASGAPAALKDTALAGIEAWLSGEAEADLVVR